MDYLKGYRVARQDPDWLSKVGIGAVILFTTAFIPIIGQIVLVGWQTLIMRKAVRGVDSPLPRLQFDFDYLGKLVGVGFKGFIVRMIWSLPIVVGSLVFGMCMYFGVVAAVIGGTEAVGDVGGFAGMCCGCGGFSAFFTLILVATIPANVAGMRAELTDDMNQGLRFKETLDFTKRNFGVLFKGTLLLGIVGTLLAFVGILACYVGAFLVGILGMVAQAHFMAQVYLADVAQGGEQLPIGPDDLDVPPGAPTPQRPVAF
jgi:hypothetical protein